MDFGKDIKGISVFIYFGIFIIPFQYLLPQKIFEVIIILISITTFGLLILSKKKWIINYYLLCYLILGLLGLFSISYSKDVSSTKSILVEILPYVLFSISLSLFLSEKKTLLTKKVYSIFLSYVIGTIMVSILAVGVDIPQMNMYTRVGFNLFSESYTAYTYYIIISLCCLVFFMFTNYRNLRSIWFILGIFLYTIAIFTSIRKAMFVPIVFYIFYLLCQSTNLKKLTKNIFRILLLLLSLILLFLFLNKNSLMFQNTVGTRLESFIYSLLGKNFDDVSLSERSILRQLAVQCFIENPIFGYGFGAFRSYAEEYSGLRLYSHNNFLELLSTMGIIGFMLYYFPQVRILVINLKKIKNKKVVLGNLHYFSVAFILTIFFSDYGTVSYLSFSYIVFLVVLSSTSSSNTGE